LSIERSEIVERIAVLFMPMQDIPADEENAIPSRETFWEKVSSKTLFQVESR
jgi:hypothetical protein